MKAYIQCCTSISHHATFWHRCAAGDCLPAVVPQEEGDTLPAIDPNYKELIDDANMRRRMSHIIKMGWPSIHCINKSGCGQPEAIITATGNGGMADTEKFLNCIIDNHEQMLNPTNFIQSYGQHFWWTDGAEPLPQLQCDLCAWRILTGVGADRRSAANGGGRHRKCAGGGSR